MSYMEHRSFCFTTCFFLFLMLPLPYLSRGGLPTEALDSEIYEIDYRGPETHSSVPPPDHFHGKAHSAHRQSPAAAAKAIMEEKVKKVHG